MSNLENVRKELNSSLAYLARLGRGEFGPMWTNTGKTEMNKLINLNRTLLRGALEELENTKTTIIVARA